MDSAHPHYIWASVAIVALLLGTWIYSSNRPDTENYAKGSTHPEQTTHNYGFINLQPGCQNIKAEEWMKAKKNEKSSSIVNTSHP